MDVGGVGGPGAFRINNADSSTSNEDGVGQLRSAANDRQLPQQLPGYGQINPAYESSRPNSLYSNGKYIYYSTGSTVGRNYLVVYKTHLSVCNAWISYFL